MKNIVDLSIIISYFANKNFLYQTIKSLKSHIKNVNYEIIIIDDCSRDNFCSSLKTEFPNLNLNIIVNKKNLGYSKSYNKGTKKAKGRYVLHLNSDVIFFECVLDKMIAFLDKNEKVGIAGAKLLKLNGNLDLPCKRSFPSVFNVFFQTVGLAKIFPKNKFFGNYYLTYLDEDKISEVDCLMGAFMMIRSDVIKDVGLLDERFFIYGEDIDYCYRTKKAGWKIVYYPKIVLKHHHGGTTSNFRWKNLWRFHNAMFLYYEKHFSKRYFFFINWIVKFGIFLRFFIFCFFDFLKSNKLLTKINRLIKIKRDMLYLK